MVSTHSFTAAESKPSSAGINNFHFICVLSPTDAKNQTTTRRLARSHAVKQALQNKRKRQQDSGDNFRVSTTATAAAKAKSWGGNPLSRGGGIDRSLCSALDPFETLPVDSSRLERLLGSYTARQAPEPVFSVAKGLAFQNFSAVFRTGLVDPALLNAVMLTFVFAETGGCIDSECLGYQGRAISCIRVKMGSVDEATTESTIGAILLLAGVEAQLGMTRQVQMHMNAVQLLLEMCRTKSVYLTSGIKRAIFWQDLNSSILAGSSRIFDHHTFSELQWRRDPFAPGIFQLQPGFKMRSHIFSKEFVEVLEDLHALKCVRDVPGYVTNDAMGMAHVNNHTASIQSRLMGLGNLSPLLKCCQLAAYISSVMLCCTVWCALVIPSHISSQLLHEIQQTNNSPFWDDNPDLLLWILYMGGAFAPKGVVRSDFVALLRLNNDSRFGDLYSSWPEVVAVLRLFVWSKKAFELRGKELWEESVA